VDHVDHLDEALLTALRDGAAETAEESRARVHLDGCMVCRDRLAALELRRGAVAAGLASLDASFDLESARAAVRDGAFPLRSRSHQSHRGAWARAAGAVLFLGAATAVAAALPRSPVRHWLSQVRHPTPATAVSAADSQGAVPAAAAETTGVRLDVPSGPLHVALHDVAGGTEIEVRWVAGSEAAIFAPVGTRFMSATGRLEAHPAGGPVRVELPRDVVPTTLEVGGRVYLVRTAQGVTVSGPVARRDDDGVVFRTPDR
jgi:hypothetical protein